jgi:hypothetical protein
MDARREIGDREAGPLRLKLGDAGQAFDDNRPPPRSVRPLVGQDRETRPLARLGQCGFGRVAFVLEDIPFSLQGVGFTLQSIGLSRDTGNLLANEQLASFPPLGFGAGAPKSRFERDRASICLLGGRGLLRSRGGQSPHRLLRWVLSRRWGWLRLGLFRRDRVVDRCRNHRRLGERLACRCGDSDFSD